MRKEKGKLKRETSSLIVLTLLIGSMLFSASSFVKCQMDIHDLRVTLEAGPTLGGHHLTFGYSRVLNATVWNDGNVPEPNVTLLILINDSVAVSSTVANLASGTSFNCGYAWSRPDNNVYNITAYAPPVFSETSTVNNAVSWLINVCDDAPPIPSIIYSPLALGPVAGENVTFDASASRDPDWGNITSYSWNFNGTHREDPMYSVYTHNFTSPGLANVTLTLKDTEGKTSSEGPLQVRVYARPNATFTVHDVNPAESGRYVGRQLIFDASNSSDPDNDTGPTRGIANYTWDFGDGPPLVTYQNTTPHTYSTDNTYPVNLTVTDYDNLTISYAQNIYIGSGIPKANFITTPGPYYVDDNLTFDASNSTGDGGEISSYNWDWNDTTTNSTTMPVIPHSFGAEGLYNVTLIVTDTDNKTSAPFNFSIPVRLPVLLKLSNSTGGNILTADPPTGTFNVNIGIVNVKDLHAFILTLKYQNESIPLLKCVNYSLAAPFYGSIIPDPNGGLIQVRGQTTPGRNGNLTLATISFAVTNPGNCTLYLSLSDYTLLNSTNDQIYVDVARERALNVAEFRTDKPFAYFTCDRSIDPIANITTAAFDASNSYDPDNDTGSTHGIANYTWNFGDGSTPTNETSPITQHVYRSPANYTVTLNVTDYTSETWWANYTLEVFYGHDVGVANVTPCFRAFNTTTGRYETAGILPIDVTVVNNGTAVETFTVTVKFDAISVKTEVVFNLAIGDNRTILFNCSITNVPDGVYNISAYAGPVPDETNPSDNNYPFDGSVRVYPQGDVNRDNKTNVLDSICLSNLWNSKPGEDNWNVDLDCDGQFNILDAIILANGFSLELP